MKLLRFAWGLSILLLPFVLVSAEAEAATQTVVLYAPYSSGSMVASHLRERFYQLHSNADRLRILAVIPNQTFHRSQASFRAGDFDESPIFYNPRDASDVERVAQLLAREDDIIGIFGLSDEGVNPAYQMGQRLRSRYPHIPLNAPQPALRSKLAALELLRAAARAFPGGEFPDLHLPDFKGSADVEELVKWAEPYLARDGKVVIQADAGAATVQTYFPKTAQAVREAFYQIYGHEDAFGHRNDFVLAKEFIFGREGAVQSVIGDGHMVISDVIEYGEKKEVPGAGNVYGADSILPFEHPWAQKLVAANARVVEAFGMRNGMGHIEIMVNPEGKAYFMEFNPRIAGSYLPELVRHCVRGGMSQVEYLVELLLEPAKFRGRHSGYELVQRGALLTLAIQKGGYFRGGLPAELAAVENNWIFNPRWKAAFGQWVDPTTNLRNVLGEMVVLGPTKKVLQERVQYIYRVRDEDGFFMPPSAPPSESEECQRRLGEFPNEKAA